MLGKKIILPLLLLLMITFSSWRIKPASMQDELTLNSYNSFLSQRRNWYYVFGEVQNIGDAPIKGVTLNITLQTQSGQKLYRTTTTSIDLILEGRKSPFTFLLTDKSLATEVKSAEVSIANYETTTETKPLKLRISAHKAENNTIVGFIENLGARQARFVSVLATFYDENQQVIAGDAFMYDRLMPASRSSFEISFPFPEKYEQARWYSLTAQSLDYAIEEEVGFTLFKGGDGGISYVFIVFGIALVFSALVLFGAYLSTKLGKQKGKKQ